MCGIVGVVSQAPVNQLLYDALLLLQHRGQDAAGIATNHSSMFSMYKANGLVRDVFRTRNMRSLMGNSGIGHCRYPTAGSSSEEEAQPFYVNAPFGITLAHNGNLTNQAQLKDELFRNDRRHINTDSDSEVLLNVLAHEIQTAADGYSLDAEAVFKAVAMVHRRVRGAYAVIAQIAGHGLLAFRDPFGIRPLCLGVNETETGSEYLVASESVALEGLGFRFVRDIAPGEAVFIDDDRQLHSRQCAENPSLNPCAFEYVYLARPDSVIDGASVYATRLKMGEYLADKIRKEIPVEEIDVVMPIPGFLASGRDPAGAEAGRRVPRRLHQEPLHRPHLHHAGPGHAQEIGAPEAECDRRPNSRTRTCCWSTTRSCAAPPAARSCRWRAKPAPARCSSPRPRRRCCTRTCTASTCRPATN
jgi:amidophosphoribosyltransferase